ncbi:ph-response sensor protein [Fusarium falciforme]|nr:ph-response sensor protein [Fusarium falciforme]
MPSAPHLGMGRRSKSSPSLANPTSAPDAAASNSSNVASSSPVGSAGSLTSPAPRATSPHRIHLLFYAPEFPVAPQPPLSRYATEIAMSPTSISVPRSPIAGMAPATTFAAPWYSS